MPSHRNNHRRGSEEIRVLCEKSSSFRRETAEKTASRGRLRRPKTAPELLSYRNATAGVAPPSDILPRAAAKLLVNVTVRGSIGPVHVLMSAEATVADLVATCVRQYSKERRRPILLSNDPADFNLHYSQFSFESLNRGEKLGELGSRNFFLCPKGQATESKTMSFSPRCKQSETAGKSSGFNWLMMFVDFLFQSDGMAS